MKIKFNPSSEQISLIVPPPQPARLYIPEWYKNIPSFATNNNRPEFDVNNGKANVTIRHCMPFADSFTTGYIQESWQDMAFNVVKDENGEEKLNFYTPGAPDMVSVRLNVQTVFSKEEYYPVEFTFHPPWTPELPKGWSMIYTSPFNREDLPFRVTTGIVDSDSYTHANIKSNLPFYLKQGFTGVIPKGTPLYQMIPMKREDWEREIMSYDPDKIEKVNTPIRNFFWGGYKKLHWDKKSFK
jgi:hypothetical protein